MRFLNNNIFLVKKKPLRNSLWRLKKNLVDLQLSSNKSSPTPKLACQRASFPAWHVLRKWRELRKSRIQTLMRGEAEREEEEEEEGWGDERTGVEAKEEVRFAVCYWIQGKDRVG